MPEIMAQVESTHQHRKKLLFVSPHFPFPPTEGGMIRTYSLVRALEPIWEMHFLALQHSDRPDGKSDSRSLLLARDLHAESFDGMAAVRARIGRLAGLRPLLRVRDTLKAVSYLRPIFWLVNFPFLIYRYQKDRGVIRNKMRSQRFDAILLDYTKMAHHFGLAEDRQIKKVLNVHNVESDTARQSMLKNNGGGMKALRWMQWKVYELYEKRFVPRCDLLLAPSPADAARYERLAPGIATVVIPNAVDMEALMPLSRPEEPLSLIYPGRMDYPPNLAAAQMLCREIIPRVAAQIPDVRLYIVGKYPPASLQRLASQRVVITGFVEDVAPYWRKVSALVVPLSVGGGTRIKILEAMALGRPVVSTSKGCEGLEVSNGRELLIADDPDAFARCVISVLREPGRYGEMLRNARKLVEDKYSFAAVGIVLRQALEALHGA